jgi:hypothetical protein
MQKIRTGTRVRWRSGVHDAGGKAEKTFTDGVSRKIRGNGIKRTADGDAPTLLIRRDGGDLVLKGRSEMRSAHG